jgi:hypothetical protein
MVWKGQAYEGKYAPLISTDLFEKVQKTLKVKSKPRKVRRGHNFPFCGLFRCSCGSMITAQWAKGHGGLYRYYRCSRKATAPCSEPYLREEFLVTQCMERIRPYALTTEEAAGIRTEIDARAAKGHEAVLAATEAADKGLRTVEEKLRKLTRCLLSDIIDEDSYRVAKEELVIERNRLKQEKERLRRSRETSWIEPAHDLVNTLETLGKTDATKRLPEISGIVRKIGTNHLLSGKNVSFSISEDYDFVPSLLASVRVASSNQSSPSSDKNWWSTKWCAREDLNLHPLRDQILSLACLPFHHSRPRCDRGNRSRNHPSRARGQGGIKN